MLFFGVIVVILTGGQLAIDGTLIDSPTDVVQTIPNTLLPGARQPVAADPDHRAST